ncbi:MAG: nucleotide exchange factor GrpE [Clostridia bacterium]|nr:nucleotide exchange factor GrpE [Clostridia bacterium]
MEEREKQIKELYERGMVYSENKKIFRGKVDESEFFASSLSDIINSFGYYLKKESNNWIAFVTDGERGTLDVQKTFPSEEEAVDYLIRLAENWNFVHYSQNIMNNFEQAEPTITEYLKQEYGYSEKQAKEAMDYLLQVKNIAFEFYNYITTGDFLSERFACNFSGYTAKRIKEETPLTLLGSFNYMVYLDRKPEEALANLKKGLPRRQVFNETKLKEVKRTMEEKTPLQSEAGEQNKQDEQPEVIAAEAADTPNELFVKLDAMQQAMENLQQCFDDKIAEDTHKNELFDNMHRELVRYQNGAVEKIVDTVALDIIQLVDTTKGHIRVYEKKEATEENYKKLLKIVKGIAEDLEDILYRQNIESYRVAGHEVDVRRQKIIQTVATDDKSKDNRIAARVADGYEKGDKVFRPERIKIFKYEENAETPSEN